jgi:predicted  nucleic acid-binding Zn-ribbon protein
MDLTTPYETLNLTYVSETISFRSEIMKLTNQQMLDVFAGLNQLSNEKFAAKLAWKIQMARTTLQPLVESLDKMLTETRQKYAIKDNLGQIVPAKDKDGNDIENTMQIAPENIKAANDELSGLMLTEVELSNVSLSLSDFPDSLEISPNTLAALSPIISAE